VSGFEAVRQDPDKARLRVRLNCRSCSAFNEIGRVYDGDERGDLIVRCRGRGLHITDTEVTFLRTKPVYIQTEPVYTPNAPEVSDLELGTFTNSTRAKRQVARIKATPLRTVSVSRAEVPGALLEVYCLTHRMCRVRGEQIAQAVAQAGSHRVVRLPIRVFSVKLPRPPTV
jgi:hypothetical protein